MKIGHWLFGAAALFSAHMAAAAESGAVNREWRGRIAELAQPGADEVVLTAVGDAIWTKHIADSKDQRLQALFEVMRTSDIAFINFEQVLADSGYPTPKEIAMADPAIISDFVWAGADIVSTANNHAMDFGSSGLETTIKTLDANNIKHSGAGMTLSDAFKPTVVERKGLKLALVSVMVSPNLNIGTAATEKTPGVAWVRGTTVRLKDGGTAIIPWDADLRAMEAAIRDARKLAPLVAVSMHIHWGDLEKVDADGKQVVARAAIDAGADMILGHGPHIVNGIEFYKAKPIIYSIGNFAFQFPPGAYTYFPSSLPTVRRLSADQRLFEAMMVRMVLSQKGEFRRFELLPVGLTPDGSPYLVTGQTADKIFAKVQELSAPYGTKINRMGWYATVDLPAAAP